jgi:anti-anti-sigma factor
MDARAFFSITDEAADEDTTVVSVTGDVDMDSASAFQRGLLRAISAGREALVVDLSGVDFIDSTALTTLSSAFDALRHIGHRGAIVCSDPNMRTLFTVSRLDREVGIYENRAKAVAGMQAAAPQSVPA